MPVQSALCFAKAKKMRLAAHSERNNRGIVVEAVEIERCARFSYDEESPAVISVVALPPLLPPFILAAGAARVSHGAEYPNTRTCEAEPDVDSLFYDRR